MLDTAKSDLMVACGPFAEALRTIGAMCDFVDALPAEVRAGALRTATDHARACLASGQAKLVVPLQEGVLSLGGIKVLSVSVDAQACVTIQFDPAGDGGAAPRREILRAFDKRMTCSLRLPPMWGAVNEADWEQVERAAQMLSVALTDSAQARGLADVHWRAEKLASMGQGNLPRGDLSIGFVRGDQSGEAPPPRLLFGVVNSSVMAPLVHVQLDVDRAQVDIAFFSRQAGGNRTSQNWIEAQAKLRRTHVAQVSQWLELGETLTVRLSPKPFGGLPRLLA